MAVYRGSPDPGSISFRLLGVTSDNTLSILPFPFLQPTIWPLRQLVCLATLTALHILEHPAILAVNRRTAGGWPGDLQAIWSIVLQ